MRTFSRTAALVMIGGAIDAQSNMPRQADPNAPTPSNIGNSMTNCRNARSTAANNKNGATTNCATRRDNRSNHNGTAMHSWSNHAGSILFGARGNDA